MTYFSNMWFARVPQLKWQRFPGSQNSTLSVSVPLLTHLHISYKYSWSWLSSATTSSGSFGNKSFITFANWWDHLAAPFQGVFEMNEALMFYHHTEQKSTKQKFIAIKKTHIPLHGTPKKFLEIWNAAFGTCNIHVPSQPTTTISLSHPYN